MANMHTSPEIREVQGLICGTIQVLVQRLADSSIEYISRVWNCLEQVIMR